MHWKSALSLYLSVVIGLSGCGRTPDTTTASAPEAHAGPRLVSYTEERAPCSHYTPQRLALYGDLHVHTAYSFDAAANSLETYPEDAQRFARGEAIPFFPLDENGVPRGQVRLERPLDFVAISDHGEFLGERALCRTAGSPKYDTTFCRQYRETERQGMLMLATIISREDPQRFVELCGEDGALCREYALGPWQDMVNAAQNASDLSSECRFSSLVGYEYTGTPGISNIHRNVIFRNGKVPDLPVSYIEAPTDRRLWRELDAVCNEANGCSYLTIPHNSNLANGRMFEFLQGGTHEDDHEGSGHSHGEGDAHSHEREHALERLANEPVMEIFQHKGNSECMNGIAGVFGQPDEHCEFEAVRQWEDVNQVPVLNVQEGQLEFGSNELITNQCGDGTGAGGMLGAGCVSETDFLRSNLLKGLKDERRMGVNSAKLGVIASTDTHSSTPGAVEEHSWGGHISSESSAQERLEAGLLTSNLAGNPGGLAGVWAVENSRDAIFEALERREVFGTSGPRIEPRFFAGWDFEPGLCEAGDMLARAYRGGVPMGSDLAGHPHEQGPAFLLHAVADRAPGATPLQQIQLIKGWVDELGQGHYKVFQVAGTPDNGAGVDLETGERHGTGHASLCTVFRDPEFDPSQYSYYYMRVLENPSPRWSLLDCLRIPGDQRPGVCAKEGEAVRVIQEMAWSSPIWYRPAPTADEGG